MMVKSCCCWKETSWEQHNGCNDVPYDQRTDLGWEIIGIQFPYNTQASGDVDSHKIIIHGGQVYLGELPCHILGNTSLQTSNNSSKPESSTADQEFTNTEILHNIDVPYFMHHVTSDSKLLSTSVDVTELFRKGKLQPQASPTINETAHYNSKILTSLYVENSSESSKTYFIHLSNGALNWAATQLQIHLSRPEQIQLTARTLHLVRCQKKETQVAHQSSYKNIPFFTSWN